MILVFRDLDGDAVAVDSAAIVAVRAGRVERDADVLHEVTLISLPSCTVAVAEPTDVVIAQWRAARMAKAAPVQVNQDTTGWLYPDVVQRSRE